MVVANSSLADLADFILRVADVPTDDLKITAFEGTEGISELFRFRVDLCSDDPDIDLDAIVGKPCVLQIAGSSETRLVNGMVGGFERTGEGSRRTYYSAEIVPCHWLLTQQHQSRVFVEQRCPDMSVPGIIKKVLTDAGIPERAYRFALEQDYQPREFVVQYRETDFDFISRLMEHEGIFYFFEHTAAGYTMVIGDSRVAHPVMPLAGAYAFRDPAGFVQERESIFRLLAREQIETGAVCLDDFDFKRPPFDLKTERTAEVHSALEYSDYPGNYVDKAVGQRYANIRLEERQVQRRGIEMAASVRSFLPGYTFVLNHHPAVAGELLVTHLTHRATQPQGIEQEGHTVDPPLYEVDVRAIAADVPFRPPAKTPRPTVQGSQTAFVVGPKDEEIYTDQYGRVKVQFHWDRECRFDELSSCWIRISQAWAGGKYGCMFLPRIGQEVIVDFLEGDPDRPLITGRVYNNDNMPPYALPEHKTRSTIKGNSSKDAKGCNEIRFDDRKGKEQLFLQAQCRMDTRVKGSHYHTMGGSYHLSVGGFDGDGELVGEYREWVAKAKHVIVEGELREEIVGDVSRFVDGNVSDRTWGTKSTVVFDDAVEAYEKDHLHVCMQTEEILGRNMMIEAQEVLTLKCGATSITLTPGALYINSPSVLINTESEPAVPLVNDKAAAVLEPEIAGDADLSKPGKDVRYDGNGEVCKDDVEEVPLIGRNARREDQTSWIELEMVDDADRPWPGEPFELKLPNGRIRSGRLNKNGFARIERILPGACEVRFPNLDAAAWERI